MKNFKIVLIIVAIMLFGSGLIILNQSPTTVTTLDNVFPKQNNDFLDNIFLKQNNNFYEEIDKSLNRTFMIFQEISLLVNHEKLEEAIIESKDFDKELKRFKIYWNNYKNENFQGDVFNYTNEQINIIFISQNYILVLESYMDAFEALEEKDSNKYYNKILIGNKNLDLIMSEIIKESEGK